jgi:uncharacterized protein (DUF2267 family)
MGQVAPYGKPVRKELRVNKGEFIDHLQRELGMADADQTEACAIVVLTSLRQRLSRAESDAVEEQLPPDLQRLWRGGLFGNVTGLLHLQGTKIDWQQFLDEVCDQTHFTREHGAALIDCVFHELKLCLSDGLARDVSRELPPSLQEHWILS